ncbi:GTPase regulator associated with the focal adhesion kinase pp125-like protein, partial [Camelus ferus]
MMGSELTCRGVVAATLLGRWCQGDGSVALEQLPGSQYPGALSVSGLLQPLPSFFDGCLQGLSWADIQVEQNRQHFYELSLEYVCKLQEIQERKKFEFVEPTRNRFEGTRSEVEELMNKIRQNPRDHKRASQFTAEGYLYVQEKRPPPFGSSWVKHYCMYRKAAKKFNIIPFEHRSGGKLGDGEVFFLKECTKRHTDSIDRRFCFDVEAADRWLARLIYPSLTPCSAV